jgi:hypothetical protein
VEDLADWGTSEEGRRLYALAVTKKNVTSNAARIACLWCVGSKSHSNDSYLVAVVDLQSSICHPCTTMIE